MLPFKYLSISSSAEAENRKMFSNSLWGSKSCAHIGEACLGSCSYKKPSSKSLPNFSQEGILYSDLNRKMFSNSLWGSKSCAHIGEACLGSCSYKKPSSKSLPNFSQEGILYLEIFCSFKSGSIMCKA